MNYNEMMENRMYLTSLSIKSIEKICALNKRITEMEKIISASAIKEDKSLIEMLKSNDDLLVNYNIVCEISFHIAPDRNEKKFVQRTVPLNYFNSDWTEKLKGISISGSNLGNGMNYNSLQKNSPTGDDSHCWLFHILYAELHLSWKEISRISAVWSNVEITRSYCVEFPQDND